MRRLLQLVGYLRRNLAAKRRVLRWLTVVAIVSFIGGHLYHSVYINVCSTEKAFEMIADTCQQYRSGVVGGSLCPALCDNDVITFKHCVNWRYGKIVAYVNNNKKDGSQETLVLKVDTRDNNYTMFDFIENKTRYTPQQLVKHFKKDIVNYLYDRYSIKFDNLDFDVLSSIWGYNVSKFVSKSDDKPQAVRAALRSIWYLVQQREYVFSKIHQKFEFSSKVPGSCGAMYFLEFSKSMSELKSGLFRGRGLAMHTENWRKRAEYGIKVLQLLPTLHNNFSESIDMCDIKEANFGLRNGSVIVLIDSDDIHYQSSYEKEVQGIYCERHAHCGRLTCPTTCDKFAKQCDGKRTNNNLQSVCERVFLNKVGFATTGLLSGPPANVKKELSALLNKCAYPPSGISPTWDDRHVSHKPPDLIRQELIYVLQKSIS